MSAPGVRVVIDRLVLHGVPPSDVGAVRQALSTELEARLAGAELSGANVGDRVRLEIAPATDPGALGRGAGRALGAALAGRGPGR